MTDTHERAKLAQLKQAFCGELDAAEQEELAGFLATEEGREFSDTTAEVIDLVRKLDVGVNVVPAPIDMGLRFERTMREQARESRKRFVPFCVGVFALFSLGLLGPVVFGKPGMNAEGWMELSIVIYGGASAFCFAVWLRNRRILRERDVIAYMAASEPVSPRSLRSRLLRWTVVLLSLAYLAERHFGWPIAISVCAAMVLFRCWGVRNLRHERLKQDAELWSWWYGEGPKSGQGRARTKHP